MVRRLCKSEGKVQVSTLNLRCPVLSNHNDMVVSLEHSCMRWLMLTCKCSQLQQDWWGDWWCLQQRTRSRMSPSDSSGASLSGFWRLCEQNHWDEWVLCSPAAAFVNPHNDHSALLVAEQLFHLQQSRSQRRSSTEALQWAGENSVGFNITCGRGNCWKSHKKSQN